MGFNVPVFPLDEFPALKKFHNVFLESPYLRRRFPDEKALRVFADRTVASILDSVLQKKKVEEELTVDAVADDGDNILRFLTDPYLPIVICVPLIGINIEQNSFLIDENTSIEKIPEALKLAYSRFKQSHRLRVYSNPTHAIFQRSWTLQNGGHVHVTKNILSLNAPAVTKSIEISLASIRLSTEKELGYQHILLLPDGWKSSIYFDLPEVGGSTFDRCPPHFLEYFHGEDTLTLEELNEIKEVYVALNSSAESRWPVVARRLNASVIRQDNEDAILDATIALEMLLGDKNDKDAISYKLRMRAAALARLAQPEGDPLETRKNLTVVYNARSSIVHGGIAKKTKGNRSVEAEDRRFEAERATAVKELVQVSRVLLRHPKYLDPTEIDQFMITGKDKAEKAG